MPSASVGLLPDVDGDASDAVPPVNPRVPDVSERWVRALREILPWLLVTCTGPRWTLGGTAFGAGGVGLFHGALP